jgi:hypothetical protein
VNGKRVTCDSGSGTSNFTREIHSVPDPVRALAKVYCQPFDVQPQADLYLLDAAGTEILRRAVRDAKPWLIEVDAGTYRAAARFNVGAPVLGDQTILMPPESPLPLPVGQS